MFQLAACPRCDVLQLHRDLDDVDARDCRRCETRVPADDWALEEEHATFEEARDRLRELRDRPRSPGRSLSGGPPVPDAPLPLDALPPDEAQALRATLRDLADADDPVGEDRLVAALSDAGAAHLLSHLFREGVLEEADVEGDEPAYRVRSEALDDGA